MTVSRLFILGALVSGGALIGGAPEAAAQGTAPAANPAVAPAAKAPAAPGVKAAAPAAKPTAAPAAAPKPAGAPAQAAPKAAPGVAVGVGAKAATQAAPAPGVAKPVAPLKYPYGLPQAKLRATHNQIEIVAGPERRPAKKDDWVLPGQRLESQPSSGAEVDFADGTQLSVGESSTLSVYGVEAVPGKKFVPGNTTVSRGDVVVAVAAPAPAPAAQAPAPAAKPGAKPAAAPAVKTPRSATIGTPVGKVTVAPGGNARITVEPTGLTRVSVYSGTATLTGKGKPIQLQAGSGSRIADLKTPPTAAAPLPPAPTLQGVQPLALSAGDPVDVKGSYSGGATPPSQWHVQVASDASFENIVRESRVAGAETRLVTTPLAPGEYYIRVSAVDTDGAEGPWSQVAGVKVAKVTLWPGGSGKRAAVQIDGKGVYCGLDGSAPFAAGPPLPLAPAQEHVVQCSTSPSGAKPEETAEYRVTAAQSGPLVAKLEAGPSVKGKSPGKGQPAEVTREVRVTLADAAGNPISGAKVTAEAAGAKADPAQEVAGSGTYVATLRSPEGSPEPQSARFVINGVETYEGALPVAVAPTPPAEEPKAADASKPEPKRAAFEMGLMPLVNVDIPRGVFAVGAGLELGARFRLPYGALAFALRPQYEYYSPSPGVSHVVAVGLPITYRFRSLNADFAPYFGVLPQFAAEYSFLARDGVAIEDGAWKTQFGLGGLIGAELRLRRGSVFLETGYRHMLNRQQRDDFATLNGVFVNLGYRVSF